MSEDMDETIRIERWLRLPFFLRTDISAKIQGIFYLLY